MADARDCEICRLQRGLGHWAWHNYCRGEMNPIALVGWVQAALPPEWAARVVAYVEAVTGMDLPAVEAALAREPGGEQ